MCCFPYRWTCSSEAAVADDDNDDDVDGNGDDCAVGDAMVSVHQKTTLEITSKYFGKLPGKLLFNLNNRNIKLILYC